MAVGPVNIYGKGRKKHHKGEGAEGNNFRTPKIPYPQGEFEFIFIGGGYGIRVGG
jgi:hypothetical protein